MKVGSRVSHLSFGEGTVVEILQDFVVVDFDKFGKKNMISSFLTEIVATRKNVETEITNAFKEENRISETSDEEIISYLIYYYEKNDIKYRTIDDCKRIITKEFGYNVRTGKELEKIVEPYNGQVFYKHLLSIKHKNKKVGRPPLKKETKKNVLFDEKFFLSKCKSDSYVELLICRYIIKKSKETEDIYTRKITFNADDFAKFFIKSLLFLETYSIVRIDDNEVFDFDYNLLDSIILQSSFLDNNDYISLTKKLTNYLYRFSIVESNKYDSIFEYIYENRLIVVSNTLLEVVRKKNVLFLQKCINKQKQVIKSLNPSKNLSELFDAIDKKIDERKFTNKFEYDNELVELVASIDFDVCTKQYFKALMSKYRIPVNDRLFLMCLRRLNLQCKKNVVYPDSYNKPSEYFEQLILKDEIHRYSNPMNIDEYDKTLKKMEKKLEIIEFETGVYLTKKSLEKSGINSKTIKLFQDRIIGLGKKHLFFSYKEIYNELENDGIVIFCYTNYLLLKFIMPIKNIKIMSMTNGVIFTFSESKNYRGDFILFLMGESDVLSVVDIQDFVEDLFGVEYSIEQIEKDAEEAKLFFSGEMEKIYKNKNIFYKEVFGDGN